MWIASWMAANASLLHHSKLIGVVFIHTSTTHASFCTRHRTWIYQQTSYTQVGWTRSTRWHNNHVTGIHRSNSCHYTGYFCHWLHQRLADFQKFFTVNSNTFFKIKPSLKIDHISTVLLLYLVKYLTPFWLSAANKPSTSFSEITGHVHVYDCYTLQYSVRVSQMQLHSFPAFIFFI